jgi:hypothetical protein
VSFTTDRWLFQLPRPFFVFPGNVPASHPGDPKPRKTVEKAQPEDISLEERPIGSGVTTQPANVLALLAKLCSREVRIKFDPATMILQRIASVMKDGSRQLPDRPFHADRFVHEFPYPAAPLAVEEA